MIGRRRLFLAIMYCGNIVKTTSGAGHVLNHGIYFVYINFCIYCIYIFIRYFLLYIYCGDIVKTTSGPGHVLNHGGPTGSEGHHVQVWWCASLYNALDMIAKS